jgi:hypothetical protein
MDGLGIGPDVPITIANQYPIALAPGGWDYVRDESNVVSFENFELYDAAMSEDTESFWYRVDYDDGTTVGPWIPHMVPAGATFENFDVPDPSAWIWPPWQHVNNPMQEDVNSAAAHDGTYGLEINQGAGNMWTYRDDLSIGDPGDTFSVWVRPPATGYSSRAYLGFGADGGGTYCFVIGFNTNNIFFYDCDPYGTFTPVGPTAPHTFTHAGWYKATIEFISLTEVHGMLFDSDGTTLLQEVTATRSTWNTPGGLSFRIFDYGGYARHGYLDTFDSIIRDPIFPTTEHTFMDNGIYYVDYQTIDDDMNWDFSSGYPVYVGPAGEEWDWISHTIFPMEIDNVDPVIRPRIGAYGELDLSIRMAGQKRNTATMRLYENGVLIGEETVLRDPGAPDIAVLPATIQMTGDYDYELTVEYDPDDLDGANPTWIFEGHFPDGKIKELRHTFNSNDPTDRVWNIGNVKRLLLGHDIIFEAEASDTGSDDLAFVWNFGDSTPFGVHIYANADPSSATDGVTDEGSLIFNQDGDRDPWFDRAPNTIRSPFGTGISVRDSISHIFDESQPYYYYVMLAVLDDDVGDGYPTTYNNGGGYDMEYAEIDFR